MLKLFDTVTLKNDDPETGVKAGTEGTIVDVLGNGKAFTVEFFDEDGNTIEASLYTEYTPAQLQKVETALTLLSSILVTPYRRESPSLLFAHLAR